MKRAAVPPPAPEPVDDRLTGLPGFRSWRAVYTLVIASFLLWVGLLLWLTRAYS